MAIVVVERSDSQALTGGDERSVEKTYDIFVRRGPGVAPMQYAEAEYALLTQTPYAIENPEAENALVRGPYQITFIDGYTGRASINYGYPDPRKIPGQGEPEGNLSFQVHAETVHITQSKSTHAHKEKAGYAAKDYKGAIGVNEKGDVAGCDKVSPRLQFSITKYLAPDVVTPSYVKTLASIVGTVNNNVFRTFEPGEVMLVGLQGTFNFEKRRWEIPHTFDTSPNATGIVIGSIPAIDKRGFDYLWIEYVTVDDAVSSSIIPEPVRAYVEVVYDYSDYSALYMG